MPNKPAKADSAVTEKAGGFRFSDFFIIVFFLFIAFVSVNLFRLDLTRTINLKNVKPVGAVIIRQNIVQRRLADRVLWDRLANESPVYMGDLIRVADLSSAILQIEDSSVDLSENTLIRITRAADGKSLQIEMSEGNLSLTTAPDSGRISLDINGLKVQTISGTVLNVKSEENNIRLQVNEGAAQFIEDGSEREINAGSLVAFEAQPAAAALNAGEAPPVNAFVVTRNARAAAVINPVPNARFINNRNTFTVNFMWNKNNFNDGETLRLEIASDKDFSRIVSVRENLDRQAEINVDNGFWYWRLSHDNKVLDEGRFSVTSSAGARLVSPAVSSIFRYEEELPVINYNWDEVEEASSYLLEISDTPDFVNPKIRRPSLVTFYADSSLGEGTWYWRVMPVFPSVYTGNTSFSQTANFRVERHIPRVVSTNEAEKANQLSLSEWLALEAPVGPAVLIPEPETLLKDAAPAEVQAAQAAAQRETQAAAARTTTAAQRTSSQQTQTQTQTRTTAQTPAPEPEVTLLPAAVNLQPARGHRFTMNDLQTQRRLNFSWQEVRGANAYIVTFFQQTETGRRQIYRTQPLMGTSYALENLRILDRGTFFWQVEAVHRRADGAIDLQGITAESSFVMDIILPGTIQDTGVIER